MVGVSFSNRDTALVITDPQNDFLSPSGSAWSLVGARRHPDRHLAAAAISQDAWLSRVCVASLFLPHRSATVAPLERLEFSTRAFARAGPLDLTGFARSGADWHPAQPRTSATGAPSSSARTRCLGRRQTISSCNSASAA